MFSKFCARFVFNTLTKDKGQACKASYCLENHQDPPLFVASKHLRASRIDRLREKYRRYAEAGLGWEGEDRGIHLDRFRGPSNKPIKKSRTIAIASKKHPQPNLKSDKAQHGTIINPINGEEVLVWHELFLVLL